MLLSFGDEGFQPEGPQGPHHGRRALPVTGVVLPEVELDLLGGVTADDVVAEVDLDIVRVLGVGGGELVDDLAEGGARVDDSEGNMLGIGEPVV